MEIWRSELKLFEPNEDVAFIYRSTKVLVQKCIKYWIRGHGFGTNSENKEEEKKFEENALKLCVGTKNAIFQLSFLKC